MSDIASTWYSFIDILKSWETSIEKEKGKQNISVRKIIHQYFTCNKTLFSSSFCLRSSNSLSLSFWSSSSLRLSSSFSICIEIAAKRQIRSKPVSKISCCFLNCHDHSLWNHHYPKRNNLPQSHFFFFDLLCSWVVSSKDIGSEQKKGNKQKRNKTASTTTKNPSKFSNTNTQFHKLLKHLSKCWIFNKVRYWAGLKFTLCFLKTRTLSQHKWNNQSRTLQYRCQEPSIQGPSTLESILA